VNPLHHLAHAIESMWWKAEAPSLLLRALTPIYQQISQRDQQSRLNRAITPSLPLISIGNITVGGSGKTPFVAWLAQQLKQLGYLPVILCRGDGGNSDAPQLLHADSLASDVGDEALLLHRFTRCPVISARNRVQGAQLAAQHGNIILLDDGFQYRQLKRCCDIVLIPDMGVGNGHLLPAGPLREPVTALGRADMIVRVGAQSVTALTHQREWQWQTRESQLSDWMQCHQPSPRSVHAITAIARPQRFIQSLQQCHIQVATQQFFPDHHRFTPSEVTEFLTSTHPIAVTAKDAVKLEPLWPKQTPLWVLEQTSEGEKNLIEQIIACLAAGQKPSQC